MNNNFYHLSLVITKGEKVIRHDYSSHSKLQVFINSVNVFFGYLAALDDLTFISLDRPCDMSIDGYHAWNDLFSIGVYNAENHMVTSVNDVV